MEHHKDAADIIPNLEDKVGLKVDLLEYTPNAAKLLYAICKQCVTRESTSEIYKRDIPIETQTKLIQSVIDSGHTSILEHITFTFSIAGISRVTSHQVVRHRIGVSVTQQSQREVSADNFKFIIPPFIMAHDDTRAFFFKKMERNKQDYVTLCEMLSKYLSPQDTMQKVREDARYLLPGACETKLVLTFNARSLMHFIALRSCMRAQWEIRNLSNRLLNEVEKVVPSVFKQAGPPCEKFRFCMEERSCGRYPTVHDFLQTFEDE